MKMNFINKLFFIVPAMVLFSCHNDLDVDPTIDPDSFTEENVFAND